MQTRLTVKVLQENTANRARKGGSRSLREVLSEIGFSQLKRSPAESASFQKEKCENDGVEMEGSYRTSKFEPPHRLCLGVSGFFRTSNFRFFLLKRFIATQEVLA